MSTSPALRIEPAGPADLSAVLALARSWQVDPRSGAQRSQGFVMASWQLADYRAFLAEAEYFLVVTHEEDFVGFLLAYSQRHAHFEPWLHQELARHLQEYMLCELMCIAPAWAHHGVGRQLMSHLVNAAAPVPCISEIAREPLNRASVGLHLALGFTPLADLVRPSGVITTLWKSPPAALRPTAT